MEYCPSISPILMVVLPHGSEAPILKTFPDSINFEDEKYLAGILGSTSAKEGRFLYVKEGDSQEIMTRFPTFFKKAEDTVRLARALIPHGEYYGGIHKTMKIQVVEPGTVIAGHRYEDGSFGFNERNICFNAMPIGLTSTYNHYMILQHLDWDFIEPDVRHLSDALASDASNIDPTRPNVLVNGKRLPVGMDDILKEYFLTLNPQLAKHPWFARGASEATSRFIGGNAFAPYIQPSCYMAIAGDHWSLPKGKYIAWRHPVIAEGSVLALDIRKEHPLSTHILGGAVATVTGFWDTDMAFSMKGAGTILDDLGDIDLVTCNKNIKISKVPAGVYEVDAVQTILQRFDRNSLLVVPNKDGIKQNLDTDGDLENVAPADDMPRIWANVKAHQDRSDNFKMKGSSDTPWTRENAIKVLLNAAGGDMGWATNLRNWWMSLSTLQREEAIPRIMAPLSELKTMLGLEGDLKHTIEGADAVFRHFIQYEIDSIKNMQCDTARPRVAASKVQSVLLDITDKGPGYTAYKRSGVAFRDIWPKFLSELDPDYVAKAHGDREIRKTWEWKVQIPDSMDGIPVHVFRLHRAALERLWAQVVVNPNPLSPQTFLDWSPMVTNAQLVLGYKLCEAFEAHVAKFDKARQNPNGAFDPSRPADAHIFRTSWQETCKKYAEEHFGGNTRLCAMALWRASHNSTIRIVVGSAFIGFPDEVAEIVTAWSGSLRSHRCVLIGAKYHFDTIPTLITVKCTVRVEGGRTWIFTDEVIPGHKDDKIGVCAPLDSKTVREGYSVPIEGEYYLRAEPMGSVLNAIFTPV
jgi:hypothetical protein